MTKNPETRADCQCLVPLLPDYAAIPVADAQGLHMSNLEWRKADVALNEGLVSNPNAEHELLANLAGVLVAVEGSFLHIDPQSGEAAYPGQTEATVTIVPASAVKNIRYKSYVGDVAAQIF